MEIEEHRIQEFDDLIQKCINGDLDSLTQLRSKTQMLGFAEIEQLISRFREDEKYHHVHYFICESYQRFDKNSAVKNFLINGENFAPSYYWAGLHYNERSDYGKAKDSFEKGYEKKHWFCGKELSDLYLHGDISTKLKGLKIRIVLAYEAMFVNRGRYYERYVYERF